MGRLQILEKISRKFSVAPASEEDVVYILSRIRKFLEINNYPEKYCVLNFYCNLALHARIDHYPQKVEDMLLRVHKGEILSDSIINFTDFHRQLTEFSKEYNLPNWCQKYKINEFNKILGSIYSDTPITLKMVRFEIVVDQDGNIGGRPVV